MDRRSVPRPQPDFLALVKRHRKRREDVMQLLDEGINVISAVNVQHVKTLNDVIASTLGVTVRETVPDWTDSPIQRAC